MDKKKCPTGKILNPATNRCVNIDGKIGRELTKTQKNKNVKEVKEVKEVKNVKSVKEVKNVKEVKEVKEVKNVKDKLYFFSKSKDCVAGMGANEVVQDPSQYATLPLDFRKVLSNFHYAPFAYNGHTYNTIEHVFQSAKIALVDEETALWFTVESGHEIGLGDGAKAQSKRKLVLLQKGDLAKWNKIKDIVMKDAAIAKYSDNEEVKRVLRATGDAELWHIVSRSKPVRFLHLEEIRDTL